MNHSAGFYFYPRRRRIRQTDLRTVEILEIIGEHFTQRAAMKPNRTENEDTRCTPNMLSPTHSNPSHTGWSDRFSVPAVCLFLAAIVWFVFGGTLRHDFVYFDDERYVFENPVVQQGLTWAGVRWAAASFLLSNWHPLTLISLMLDRQLFGSGPAGFHLTNVLLHGAAVILLFLVLRRMTGALWRSAFVAAVFAIHPLRVESVAWVAERKDVLSGLFFMLTLWFYVRYAQKRTQRDQISSTDIRFPWLDYLLVLTFFAAGLLSKPMLVTLPVILLLLDYWPLNRLQPESGTANLFVFANLKIPQPLLLEKLPLFGLSLASCVITIIAQRHAIQNFEHMSLPARLENATTSYVTYIGQMFWPVNLAVYYPFNTGELATSTITLSLLFLIGITVTPLRFHRRRPYLLGGWLWYLIMLLPVIGILQVGAQARADRYTYLPQIGLYILLTWVVADLSTGWRCRKMLMGAGSGIIIAVLMVCAHKQVAYWQNTETLWEHTIACTGDNLFAENNLGAFLLKNGKLDEAQNHFEKALHIQPRSSSAHHNLAMLLAQKGDFDGAIAHFQEALKFQPAFWQAHGNLASVLFYQKGKADEALAHCLKALEINPRDAQSHTVAGHVLLQKGRDAEAVFHYHKAIESDPNSVIVLNNLAETLAISPDASLRNGALAVRCAERACALTKNSVPEFIATLAASYAEAGRFDEAIEAAQRTCALASAGGQSELLEKTRTQLDLYLAHRPYHRQP